MNPKGRCDHVIRRLRELGLKTKADYEPILERVRAGEMVDRAAVLAGYGVPQSYLRYAAWLVAPEKAQRELRSDLGKPVFHLEDTGLTEDEVEVFMEIGLCQKTLGRYFREDAMKALAEEPEELPCKMGTVAVSSDEIRKLINFEAGKYRLLKECRDILLRIEKGQARLL